MGAALSAAPIVVAPTWRLLYAGADIGKEVLGAAVVEARPCKGI